MSIHAPAQVEVLDLACYYGDCDHGGDECPPITVTACATCLGPLLDDEIATVVPWPCADAPKAHDSGTAPD